MNPYTFWLYGSGQTLSHKNPYFNFGGGEWELVIHSLIVDDTDTSTKTSALLKISSNLVRHTEIIKPHKVKVIQTPLQVVGYSRQNNYKTFRFTGTTNFVVTNKEDEIVFKIKTCQGTVQEQRKFGLHVSLIRLS